MSKRFSATEAKAITLEAQKKIEECKKVTAEKELDYLFDEISKAAQEGNFYINIKTNKTDNDIVTMIKASLKDGGFKADFLRDEDDNSPYYKISWF